MQFEGSRIAFHLFGIPVYWYAILLVTGMIVAIYGASKLYKKIGGDEEVVFDLSLWILPISIIGARAYYVIFEWDQYAGDLMKMIDIRSGGLAIHGGVIAGVLVGYIFTKKKKLKFFPIADVIMTFLPLAQAIGRWGNFINNEAHGGPTDLPWGVIIDGQKYHPTFLYESLGNIIIFFFLLYFFNNKQKRYGQTSALYLILYGVLRFFVEGLRTDSLWWGPIRVAQLVSLIFIILGIVFFIIQARKYKDQDLPVQENLSK
ncbi:MAG: prolipoprotein diacylglyceryl transferase [Tissierellia bacterium]|nr:prolipoprotein diacylglyceryl transferase [Tissierellia bacterium]